MGSGSAKAHEHFTVEPSLTASSASAAAPPHVPAVVPTAGAEHGATAAPAAAEAPAIADVLAVDPGEEAAFLEAIGITTRPERRAEPMQLEVVPPTAQTSGGQPLIPIPTEPPVGDPLGAPLLLAAGADLEDGTASLIAYNAPGGAREVLVAYVTPEAEEKLMEALEVSGKTIPVEVEREVLDYLPQDVFFAAIEPAAKVVNKYLKHGTGDVSPAIASLNQMKSAIEQRLSGPEAGEPEHAMLTSYLEQVNGYLEAAAGSKKTGAKLPFVTKHKGPVTKLVTEHVPAPATGAGLPALQRPVSRIHASINAKGVASWDGVARKETGGGIEYRVDLGDGYTAVYRPYAGNDGGHAPYSLRGALELSAPPGRGHGQALVQRLQQLHLVSDPMSRDEAEVAYLRANIQALGLGKRAGMKKALAPRPDLEELAHLELLGERAHELAGVAGPQELKHLSREIVLQAERRASVARLPELRDAVAAALGRESGAALTSTPGYDPVPLRSGGWHTWHRLDVGADPSATRKAFGKRGLVHSLSVPVAELIRNGGVLASTERRVLMGVRSGIGMSEDSDKHTGGARSVFLRMSSLGSSGGDRLEWSDPTVLLRRTDWYAYPGDHFGATNPKSHNFSASSMTTDPLKLATFNSHGNEVMIRHGIDLLGAEAPSRIRCSSAAKRDETLAALAARGVTHLGGKPVHEVVLC